MTDLDPAMLAKFQKFQAMLAESPEIVEALNSPELLELAKIAAEKKQAGALEEPPELEPEPEQAPERNYPMVGHGHSDDVSVMSEMTIPTVVTRQTVEEEEYYPEIDATGVSTSGLGATRRIGMKIGVNVGAFETNGALPPPPPKPKTHRPGRRGRTYVPTKAKTPVMSKISEHDGSVTSESTEPELRKSRPPLTAKKGNWKPNRSNYGSTTPRIEEPAPIQVEKHPFNTGTTTASKNRSGSNGRGVLRNRSMPVNLKVSDHSTNSKKSEVSDSGSGSQASFEEDVEEIQDVVDQDETAAAAAPEGEDRSSSPGAIRPRSASKLSSSSKAPRRTSETIIRGGIGNSSGERKVSRGRSVPRMRLVPVTKNTSPKPTATKGTDQEGSSAQGNTRESRTGVTPTRSRGRTRTPPPPGSKGQPKKPLVVTMADSDDDLFTAQEHEISNPIVAASLQKSQHGELAGTDTEEVKPKPSTNRRWTPPSKDDTSNLPPAFRKASKRPSGSGLSQKSRDSTNDTRSSRSSMATASSLFSCKTKKASGSKPAAAEDKTAATVSSSSDSSDPIPPKPTVTCDSTAKVRPYSPKQRTSDASRTKVSGNRTHSDEPTKSATSSDNNNGDGGDDDEEDYVPRKLRNTAKSSTDKSTPKTSRTDSDDDDEIYVPDPENFKKMIYGGYPSYDHAAYRPDEYVHSAGTSTRIKKEKPKPTYGTKVNSNRVDEWLGSGKTQKRTWRVKTSSK